MSGVKRLRANRGESKTTVSLHLETNLVEKARSHMFNLSRITEQALSSIPDYLETQNIKTGSQSLNPCSLQRENGRAGSSAWYECRIRNAEIAGSNPARSTRARDVSCSIRNLNLPALRSQTCHVLRILKQSL